MRKESNYLFSGVRTVEVNGKILFCGKDIAKALGYANPKNAVRTHCSEVFKVAVPTKGGIQSMNFITETDSYRLIIRSKLSTAKEFERRAFETLIVSPSASTPQAKKEPPCPYLSRRGWEDLKTAGMVVALLGLLAAIIVITTVILQPAHAEETALAPHITRAAVPEAAPEEPAPLLPDVPLDPELLETVAEACARYNVPLEIALGVMETESCYQPDAVNGPCVGLYQINTEYAAAYIDALGVTDIAEPAQNIECGVWYLGQLLQKHGDTDLALMHYNLGNMADELWAAGVRSTAYTDKVNAAAGQINISRNGQ